MTDEQIKAEVQAWLAENWRGAPERIERFGRDPRSEWFKKVRDARWAVPRWKHEQFGRGLPDAQAWIVERAFEAVGAPGTGQDRSNLWANTALAYATETFKQKIVPQLLAGEVGMCLLYSEPGAGSDLAAVRTRADKVDGGWRVTGQKVWTSGAHIADYGMLIARTDWDVPKHRGISFFFLPMRQQGVEVRPLRQITDEAHFNEVFITDAFVPDENLLGPLNGGWGVLQTALAYERSVM
ncbi:MAG: acyl-CoA dehydrogenase family protein, partial [Burkholderiaceae bacterium]